jgi:SAM-dependent methyltransferase
MTEPATAPARPAAALDAQGYYQRGLLAINERRPGDAIPDLSAAIELRFEFSAAHRMLGIACASLGQWEAAEASLVRALSLEPRSPDILFELATVVAHRGKHCDAACLLARALMQAPQPLFKRDFVNAVLQSDWRTDDAPLRWALAAAVTGAWVPPDSLCRPALALIMLDERIAQCVHRAQASWPERLPRSALFGPSGLGAAAADPLLHALLETIPVNSMSFERFLTGARHALLETASSMNPPDPSDLVGLPFYAALAQQCFINEYVFADSEPERAAANDCRTRLVALLDADAAIPPLLLLAVAAYFPLHGLPDSRRLLRDNPAGPLGAVLRQQVIEPLDEVALRADIERLTPIADEVSLAVRNQYEENPYPRWVKMPVQGQPLALNDELRRTLPFVPFTPMFDDGAPEILVAGCGTGRDALLVAQRFSGARVLAVDLSLSSISYAKRKTRELGVTNIRYAQADILKLGDLAVDFDLIGAVGVLHHLADPFRGWRALLSRLRPGGYMCLGLYSQLGRRQLLQARDLIAARGYTSAPEDIRRFRQEVFAQGSSPELQLLSQTHSFYALSDCRDLAFHVQEHQLSLPQIDSFLAEQGLEFLGFELDRSVIDRYRARFSRDRYCVSLANWARFELDHPDTFTAMYRFWIQKPNRVASA